MNEVHYIPRPPLVHQLAEREKNVYRAKCGYKTMDGEQMTGFQSRVTCDRCDS